MSCWPQLGQRLPHWDVPAPARRGTVRAPASAVRSEEGGGGARRRRRPPQRESLRATIPQRDIK